MTIIHKHLYLLQESQEVCFDDVFLCVWNHINSYDHKKSTFKNWIAAITRNKTIDYLRKYKYQIEELCYSVNEVSTENLIILLNEEISQETEKMLSCLSEQDRDLFVRL